MDRANDLMLLLGRLLMAALFLPSGITKLMGFSGFAASLATKGLPYPEAWAAAAVAIEVLGPIALILGFLPRWTALLLIARRGDGKRHHASLLGVHGGGCSSRTGNQLLQ